MDFEEYRKEIASNYEQNCFDVTIQKALVFSAKIYYYSLSKIDDKEIVIIPSKWNDKYLAIFKNDCVKNKLNLKHLIINNNITNFCLNLSGCKNLKTLYLTKKIKKIDMNCFDYSNVIDIFFEGSIEEFKEIELYNKYNYDIFYKLGLKNDVKKIVSKGYLNFSEIIIHYGCNLQY